MSDGVDLLLGVRVKSGAAAFALDEPLLLSECARPSRRVLGWPRRLDRAGRFRRAYVDPLRSGGLYELWHDWATLSGIDRMVAAGVLACNPHNTQAWRFTVAGDVISVYSDPSRRMPLNDASAREHFAGLGCGY